MGREAYRLGAKFIDPEISIEVVIEELFALGAIITTKGSSGQSEIEIPFAEGFLEMLLYSKSGNRKSANQTILEMRFAKVNSVDLVDRIINVMRKLKEKQIIEEVGDLEKRETIDLEDYSRFKERVRIAKEEFESWHHPLPTPIRCSEVYETYHRLYPDEYKPGNNIENS